MPLHSKSSTMATIMLATCILFFIPTTSSQGFDMSGIRNKLDTGVGWDVCPYCDLCANLQQCWDGCEEYMCQFCPYLHHCFSTCKTDCMGPDPADTWYTWGRFLF